MTRQKPEAVSVVEPPAYSYIRFSDPSQSAGDSLRRQTKLAAEWCKKNRIHLDTSLSLRDLGVSGFRGKHRTDDKYALAQFLKLVERGRIVKGSYLVIENLDRLSREDERAALRLWMDILDAGINIVQLKPETIFRHEKSDLMDVMRAIIELSRGHSESARKSERVGAAWEERRRKTREEGALLTRKLPAWVEVKDGKLALIPDRAATVQNIFALAGSGYGLYSIMKKLTNEKVAPFGPSKKRPARWSISYLHLLLSDRRALGEFQPKLQGKNNGKPDGDPIPDYYPRVVSDEAFERARLGAKGRWRRPGRIAEVVNVFQGLLKGARDGLNYTVAIESSGPKRYHVVRSTATRYAGGGRGYSFPLATFEAALFKCLREIDPHEILNGDTGPDETIVLSGEQARLEASIDAINADMDQHGETPELLKRMRAKGERLKEVGKLLDEARQRAANPLSESWGEVQELAKIVQEARERGDKDALLRLRAALRRIADSIWVLIVPRGRDRLAWVQIWFTGEKKHRNVLILHRPSKANAKARTEGGAWCDTKAKITKPGHFDLRQRGDALAMEKRLGEMDLGRLTVEECRLGLQGEAAKD